MTAALTDPPKTEVEQVRLSSLCPCPANDGVYGKQSLVDPDILSLIESIRKNGLREPIHIDADNVILSGHRRRFCAFHAGLRMVPVIRHDDISYAKDPEAFTRLLIEMNEQRKKTAATLLREAAMRIDPEEARAEMRQEQKDREDERRYGS
jgi:ParB-like nuclease domain